VVRLDPGIVWEADDDPVASRQLGRTGRVKVRKPRLPWRYARRSTTPREYTECGRGRIYRDQFTDMQGYLRAVRKKCGPRKLAREFDVTGAEGGTLVGARRAAGLFDDNWDKQFPLTRKERELLEQGKRPEQFFFEPPTTPAPENWIDDKIRRIRGTFGPTKYQTAKGWLPFCPQGGLGLTCAGPDGEVGWVGGSVPLTPLDVQRFKEAYCAPGQCQTGGKISPPAGYREVVVKTKPRNPAVLLKASCQPVLAPAPVVMDVPPGAPPGPAPAPPPSWECDPFGPCAIVINCGPPSNKTGRWIAGTPYPIVRAWLHVNCGWPPP
jgi:hypothetical protein